MLFFFLSVISADLPGDLAYKMAGNFGEVSVMSLERKQKRSNKSGEIWSIFRGKIQDEYSQYSRGVLNPLPGIFSSFLTQQAMLFQVSSLNFRKII